MKNHCIILLAYISLFTLTEIKAQPATYSIPAAIYTWGSWSYYAVSSVDGPAVANTNLEYSGTSTTEIKAGGYIQLKPGFSAKNFSTGGQLWAHTAAGEAGVAFLNGTSIGKYEKLELGVDMVPAII
jgi:hypothetical protein